MEVERVRGVGGAGRGRLCLGWCQWGLGVAVWWAGCFILCYIASQFYDNLVFLLFLIFCLCSIFLTGTFVAHRISGSHIAPFPSPYLSARSIVKERKEQGRKEENNKPNKNAEQKDDNNEEKKEEQLSRLKIYISFGVFLLLFMVRHFFSSARS